LRYRTFPHPLRLEPGVRLSPHRAQHLWSFSKATHPEAFLRISPAYTDFTVDSLRVRWIPLLQSFHRLGAFAMGTHPRVHGFPVRRLLCPIRLSPGVSTFRETFPSHYFPTALDIPRGVSRVRHVGLKQDGLGGTFLVAPSTLCGFPVPVEGKQVRLYHLLQTRSCVLHRFLRRRSGFELDWRASQVRYARVSLPRRAMRASGDSPSHLSAKRHLLETSLLLMASFRCMLLTS
jgi:hypothetical protein